jgi:hypothetical protein
MFKLRPFLVLFCGGAVALGACGSSSKKPSNSGTTATSTTLATTTTVATTEAPTVPTTEATTAATTAPPASGSAPKAGQFCSTAGSTTVDANGATLYCRTASDGRLRWEHTP